MLRHDELRASQREFSVKEMPALRPVCFPRTQRDFCFIQLSAIPVLQRQELEFLEKGDYYLTHFFLKLIAILPLFLSITLCFSRFFCFRGWKTWTGFDSLAQNVTFLWIWIEASYLTVFLILEIWQYQFVSLAWILKTSDALVLSVYLSPSVHSELSKGVSHAQWGLRKK